MSGLEVIGGISAVITIFEACVKVCQNARKDLKLSEAFAKAGRQLPILIDILQRCRNHLKSVQHSIDTEVWTAMEKITDGCEQKAEKLRTIFEKVMSQDGDEWQTRYTKVMKRWGKGNKVEDLLVAITEDVQLIVNHRMVKSVESEQLTQLDDIIKDMKIVQSSVPEDETAGTTFESRGGAQTNNVNSGSGQQINNNAAVGTQYFGSVTIKPHENFSFQKPVGFCIGQAPTLESSHFVGRTKELDQMAAILEPEKALKKVRRLVIGGPGGVGKTQLAIAYAEAHRDDYQSVFWVNAANEATVKDEFRSIAQWLFGLSESGSSGHEESKLHVHRWLSDPQNLQWLLIFDGYDDPNQFDIVKNYYPQASQGTIIITTRQPDSLSSQQIRLGSLDDIQDSLAILRTRSRRQDAVKDPHAERLVERLGRFPLALATAGAYLSTSSLSYEEYLDEYEKSWDVDPYNPVKLPEYQDRTLHTTWMLSYRHIESKRPEAAQLLKLLAYFDNQNIPYELLSAGARNDLPESLCTTVASKLTFTSVMKTLTDYCFVELQQSAKSWRIHNCVHDWLLAKLNESIDLKQYEFAFSCTASVISNKDSDTLATISYAYLAAHAVRLVLDRFWQCEGVDDIVVRGNIETSKVAELLEAQARYAAAEQMYRRILSGKEKTLEPDDRSVLDTLDSLGSNYMKQDRLDEAEQMYQRALAGKEKILGPEHESTLDTINGFGILHWNQDRMEEAEQMYQKALSGREKTLGPEHKSTLDTITCLGRLYAGQSRLEEAEQSYQRSLTGIEKTFGPDNMSVLKILENLANLYEEQDRLDKAEQAHRRALTGLERTLGPEHLVTLSAVANLGKLYGKREKLDMAEQMYQRALSGMEKILGLEHSSTLTVVELLGNLYKKQDKFDLAEQMYQRALTGMEQTFGLEHSKTLTFLVNLGNLYKDQDRLEKSEQANLKALAGLEKTAGPDHFTTLATVTNLGRLYQKQEKLDLAEQMFQRALTGMEQTFGPEHSNTLTVLVNLGNLYKDQDKLDVAEQIYQRILAGQKKAFGPEHSETLKTIDSLGVVFRKQGRREEAEQMHQRALAGMQKVLGSDHTSALSVLENLGLQREDQNELREARDMFQRVSEGRNKTLGPDHDETKEITDILSRLDEKIRETERVSGDNDCQNEGSGPDQAEDNSNHSDKLSGTKQTESQSMN